MRVARVGSVAEITFIWGYGNTGKGMRNGVIRFIPVVWPLLTPSSVGRIALPRTAWRGRCTGPPSLRAS